MSQLSASLCLCNFIPPLPHLSPLWPPFSSPSSSPVLPSLLPLFLPSILSLVPENLALARDAAEGTRSSLIEVGQYLGSTQLERRMWGKKHVPYLLSSLSCIWSSHHHHHHHTQSAGCPEGLGTSLYQWADGNEDQGVSLGRGRKDMST